MKIGIDFDNTIARYDSSFRRTALANQLISQEWTGSSKTELRDYLRTLPEGEQVWMKLQGQVYGKFMHQAEIMPGFVEFLLKCRLRGHKVFIVSHKTEFGHFDVEQTSLREEAMKWMESKCFFEPDFFCMEREHVFFADTREEKVAKIAELECDCFIDDLPEVFAEKTFPESVEKVLYGSYPPGTTIKSVLSLCSWEEISHHLLGISAGEEEKSLMELMTSLPIEALEKVSGRGNSRIYKVRSKDGSSYALKIYPGSDAAGRSRLMTEYNAIGFLRGHGFAALPELVSKDENSNFGLYSWIEGSRVDSADQTALQQAVGFISRLHQISRQEVNSKISLASEACLSLAELVRQVEARLQRLQAVSGKFPSLRKFLEREFQPLWQDVTLYAKEEWPESSKTGDLPECYRILSPSDFGFHNAISVDGQLTFIDFEYFGWDDPVKLTADFLWHPAMTLEPEIAAGWQNAMLTLFADDPNFARRLNVAMPLYGMRWIMILLNEFLPGMAERRRLATGGDVYDEAEAQRLQLQKAALIIERVTKIQANTVVFADNKA
jgi:thiamine kinase-like enzyme